MRTIIKGIALGSALSMTALAAEAEDAALVLTGSDYRTISDAASAAQTQFLLPTLQAKGFRVFSGLNLNAEESWNLVEQFRAAAQDGDRVFVLLAGHVVSTRSQTWLLTRYADGPSDLSVGASAVPLGPILDAAAEHPGQAVVMIAPSGREITLGRGVVSGVSGVSAPQGVTLISGPIDGVVRLSSETILQKGAGLATALKNPPHGVVATGFMSDHVAFLPEAEVAPQAEPSQGDEVDFWQVVQALASLQAYESYLERYPTGPHTDDARAAIEDIKSAPERKARMAETALGLSRDQRRDIQRGLSILGYDPRGIDGIFGRGSRAAIRQWQSASGYDASGYMTAPQLAALNQTATQRARELEAEAARRRAEQERLDAVYWRETGRNGDEPGLRAYLKRYPDGLYSELAHDRLGVIEQAKRTQLEAEERNFWDDVEAEDSVEGYRLYLERYPQGAFAEAALARLDELAGVEDQAAIMAAARAEEARVAGNSVSRLLVENRLAAFGLNPGPVDGQFEEQTRKALRQFQRAREMPVTGFVSQETMVRLLSGR